MTSYMDLVGNMGKSMMYRTACVQVNLDFSSEADMVQKLRVALALQPVAIALFSNSLFFEGKPNGHKSWRSRIWRSLDDDRTGMLPFVFETGMGFERYVDYALDVPMYFVYRNGKYLNALGQSFRDFLKGELPALPGEIPKISDWADHLTTIFPEVRLKQFLEMRGADSGSWSNICALPAFWVGLLYDSNSLEEAWDICKNWSADDREGLRQEAAKNGLTGTYNKISIIDITKKLLDLSTCGLVKRGKISNNKLIKNESHFLEVLHKNYKIRSTPADELLKKYYGNWGRNLDKIYDEYSY